MGLLERTGEALRFLAGQRQFEGRVKYRRHRVVGDFQFPVTLYGVVGADDSRVRLCEDGHNSEIGAGDIVRGYRSSMAGASEENKSWYKIVRIERLGKA